MVDKQTIEEPLSSELQQLEPPNEQTQEAVKSSIKEPLKVDSMSNNKTKKSSSGLLTTLIFILVLVSLGASVFLWQQIQFLIADQVKNSSYQLEVEKKNQAIKDLQEELSQVQTQLLTAESDLDNLLQEQEQLKTTIAGISGVNRVDWLVDELLHLTRLAHQRLILSHDAEGAIALLKAADQVVIEMRQSSALAVRQAIASDLLELQVAADVDLEGAYIRLDSLSSKIEELNFKQPNYPTQGVMEVGEPLEQGITYNDGSFENQLGSAWSHILTKLQPYLYRSFRIDGDVKPLLNSDEREYLARNMVLAIEEAQLALLRREAESYRLSLEQSEKWIKQYYDDSDPLTMSVLTIIEELKTYRLNPKMPEINATLDAVKIFSENWQQEKVDKQQLRRSLAQ